MAYNLQKKYPLDLQPRKGIGIGYPLSAKNSQATFTTTYESRDAVKANLLTYFLTGKNERVLNTTLGSGLRKFLFEPITNTTSLRLKNEIEQDLLLYFPRIRIRELSVTGNAENTGILLKFKYSIVDTIYNDEEFVLNIEQ